MSLVIRNERCVGDDDDTEGQGGLGCDEPGCEKRYHCRSGGTDLETIQRQSRKRGWETRRLNAFGDTADFCPKHKRPGKHRGLG